MANTPKLKSAKVKSEDDAQYSAAKLEEEEKLQELNESVQNGITLNDSDEPQEYEMLCGYKDKDGVMHRTFTIREMNGRDEEAIDRPDFKQNSSKAISALLSRLVQSIGTLNRKDFKPNEWDNIIKSLYTGDQDYILMQIRRQSVGNEIEVTNKCPSCGMKLHTFVDIDELEIVPFNGEREAEFDLVKGFTDKKGVTHKTGKIRLATGFDRELLTPVAKRSLAKANTLLLTRLCVFDGGVRIDEDDIRNLVVRDREKLTQLLADMAFGYKLQVDVTCDQCGEEFTASLNAVNFT